MEVVFYIGRFSHFRGPDRLLTESFSLSRSWGVRPGVVNERVGITEHEIVRYIVQVASEILVARGLEVIEVPPDLSASGAASWINERASSTDLTIEVHLNSVACQPRNPFCTDAQGPEILYRVGDTIG